MRKKEYPEYIICIKRTKWTQYLWTWRQSFVPNDAPRDFGPEVAFGAKLQIPVARQGGREMSAPRPYGTDPFRPLGSICNNNSLLYICQSERVICSMWCLKVCLGTEGIWQLRMWFSASVPSRDVLGGGPIRVVMTISIWSGLFSKFRQLPRTDEFPVIPRSQCPLNF